MATAIARFDNAAYRSTLAEDFRAGSLLYEEPAPVLNSLVSRVAQTDQRGSMLAGTAYRSFLDDLELLRSDAELEDDCPISNEVYKCALLFAVQTVEQLLSKWFEPRLATDSAGGIRMTWTRATSEIRAVIPADRKRVRYLYIEESGVGRSVPNFNSITLANELKKLV